jgi:Holliday junction DNA helicase RuvA
MIGYVRGTLAARMRDLVLVETPGGLGLEVQVSRATLASLPEPGAAVTLWTHLIIREDHWQLAGFQSETERAAFLALLQVTGVGAKVGLAVLGHLDPPALAQAVRDGQWRRLQEVPGVGPKLAQRMVVELRGWAGTAGEDPDLAQPAAAAGAPADDDVVEGLRALGLAEQEARQAVRGLEHLAPVERLREALRRLDRGRGVENG